MPGSGQGGQVVSLVSVPFNAGRGLMHGITFTGKRQVFVVSVPFNAGRGLMPDLPAMSRCEVLAVSVPFNAGRGLMRFAAKAQHVVIPAFQYPSMRVVD